MGKRFWAITIKRNLINFAVVFCIGALIDYLANEPEWQKPLTAGGIAIVVYLAVLIALGLIHLVANLLYMGLFREGDLEGAILDDLRSINLPAPTRYQSKSYDYLSEAMDDDGLLSTDRIRAAFLLGTYQVMNRGVFNGLIFRRAADKAFLQYANQAPERRPSNPDEDNDNFN